PFYPSTSSGRTGSGKVHGQGSLGSPCASAEERRADGGSRRGLSERPQGASSAAVRLIEYRREARRAGAPGSPFLWLLSFGEAKESDLQPAAPANLILICTSRAPFYPSTSSG